MVDRKMNAEGSLGGREIKLVIWGYQNGDDFVGRRILGNEEEKYRGVKGGHFPFVQIVF